MTNALSKKRILVVGGSRGLGLGVAEALAEAGAELSLVARGARDLATAAGRLGAEPFEADAREPGVAERLLGRVRPEVVIVNAGAVPATGRLSEMSWERFSNCWNADVQLSLSWVQAALKLPLAPGARVVLVSSGAALLGSPLSGGYAGAKRMVWLLAGYANAEAVERGLGLHFQAVLPLELVGQTDVGGIGAATYAARAGVSPEAFLATDPSRMTARQFGGKFAELLSEPAYAAGVAFGIRGSTGITSLDTKSP